MDLFCRIFKKIILKLAGITETTVFLKLQHLTALESALNSQTLKNQVLEQDKERLLKETADRDQRVRC